VFPILEKWVIRVSYGFNVAGGICILAMMFLTCSDVFLRIFQRPITGAYELVGFLGALFVSFSLAHTSFQRGHIAVDFLVQKLSDGARVMILCINDLLGSLLFGLIAYQSMVYGSKLKSAGEVSMTLKLPVFPVVYGIGLGCGLLSLLLLVAVLSHLFKRNEP
jgi:TRAP-type C4-dicarboxylate transport system permease small subunit